MEKQTILKVQGLVKTYGRLRAVDGVGLEVYQGDVYGFLGPNGSGKTTTIRTILGLITPDAGSVEICGANIATQPNQALAQVGAVVENPTMYQYMSGRKNLYFFADIQGVPRDRAEELLELVGLKERGNDKVSKYSLGMKQRLGIAQALLGNPSLVILDEPTNGLDPHGTVEIRELIQRLSSEHGITFFVSSHLLHEVELICNRVSVLRKGKVVSEGYVSELLKTETEELRLEVSNLERAKELLATLPEVLKVSETEGKLLLSAQPDSSSKIAKLLIQNDVMVSSIAPVPLSLESFFMAITQGEDNISA